MNRPTSLPITVRGYNKFAATILACAITLWGSHCWAEDIVVSGKIFNGTGKDGDFGWMILQDQYRDVLFIFNDNVKQFTAHQNDSLDPEGCSPGGGNAIIRPYQCLTPPRAAGIPTGPD
jgi:hypothetical protein